MDGVQRNEECLTIIGKKRKESEKCLTIGQKRVTKLTLQENNVLASTKNPL